MPIDLENRISFSIKPDKGKKNGSCNRTACQAPGAVFYNNSTMKYYCASCAEMINQYYPGICTLEK